MNRLKLTLLCTGIGAAWMLCATFSSQAQQPEIPSQSPPAVPKKVPPKVKEIDAKYRLTVASARERATVMHDLYESTLHVMHRHYFRNGRSTLPARAMEDVFSEMSANSKIDAQWIAVNTQAMSIDHEPETEFEKQAAKEIAEGKHELELIEDGYYRRATPIPLTAGCVSCHTGLLAQSPKSQRYAGLIISVPIKEETPVKAE